MLFWIIRKLSRKLIVRLMCRNRFLIRFWKFLLLFSILAWTIITITIMQIVIKNNKMAYTKEINTISKHNHNSYNSQCYTARKIRTKSLQVQNPQILRSQHKWLLVAYLKKYQVQEVETETGKYQLMLAWAWILIDLLHLLIKILIKIKNRFQRKRRNCLICWRIQVNNLRYLQLRLLLQLKTKLNIYLINKISRTKTLPTTIIIIIMIK